MDRALLEKLERLTLCWLRSYQGLLGGHNRSHFPGSGHEFLDHRNFYPGDDLRAVNWRAYLRFERFLLRTFELEPRVPVRILLDVSASMSVDGKFDYSRRLAIALTYVALVKLDSVTLQPFVTSMLRPTQVTGGRQRIHQAASFLDKLTTAGCTDFRSMVRSFIASYRKPGLLVVISDFLGDNEVFSALQTLADFGHELLLLQVYSPEDRHPEFSGVMELIDSEHGLRHHVEIDAKARRMYSRSVEAHNLALNRLAARNDGRYVEVSTQTPVEDALFGPVGAVIGNSTRIARL